MFDRTFVYRGPESLHCTVNEKRAPTDESVKLLKEMESAARSKIVESMRIKSNDVEAIVHRQESMVDLKTLFAIHYAVNGKKREVLIAIDSPCTIGDSLHILWKRLAEDIAEFILNDNIRQAIGK